MSLARTKPNRYGLRGNRRHAVWIHTAQGVMWGSLTWPLFAVAAFVAVDVYANRKPRHRLPD